MPAVWAGSEQPNGHAVGMPSLLSARFIEQISELFLGSGPRGRKVQILSPRPSNSAETAGFLREFGPFMFLGMLPKMAPDGPLWLSISRI
jgi:hypothetical protein